MTPDTRPSSAGSTQTPWEAVPALAGAREGTHDHLPALLRHEVHVKDGRFALAVCTCGWHGVGRRLRATARAEGQDHALLYADARTLSS